ncbi:MAG: DUF2332 domain-containing protein [Acidimicrobiales bacterium]
MTDRRLTTIRRFRGQAAMCSDLGSPLYGHLLERAADDIEGEGPVWRCIEPIAGLPGGALVALRFMGAFHHLALDGHAPALAAHYPSCGGDGDTPAAWAALRDLVEEVAGTERVAALLARGVQTNEVGRAAALLGGFLGVASRTRLPMRLLEIGTSAGLNLRWDRFRYVARDQVWGPPQSPVDQGDPWVGGNTPSLVPRESELEIAARYGCDLAPVDPTTDSGRTTLLCYVWPDMERRFRLLAGACDVAATTPAQVDASTVEDWLPARLAEPSPGAATVVFHSVFMQYLTPEARASVVAAITAAGEESSEAAPLAWLRLEPPGLLGPTDFEVRLTTWPGGDERFLATAHPHGAWVRWDG